METKKPSTRFGRLLLIILMAGALAALVFFAPILYMRYYKDVPSGELHTGGTSAATFMVDKWKDVYRKEKGVKISFKSTGSTEGIAKVIDRKLSISFTHNPLSAEQKKKAQSGGGDVLHIPVAICAVVPIYNIKELKGQAPLNLTREVLADVFLGNIKRWNDSAIAAINPKVKLPDLAIEVVHREDSSGTTYILTEYLHGVSAEWDKKIGPPASKIAWPVGAGMERTGDLVAQVIQTNGAIGYADLLHAFSNNRIAYAAVQNKDKSAFLRADPETMAASAEGLAGEIGDDLTFRLVNKPGKNAYPICGGIWAVCYQTQPPKSYQTVADFLHWATHDGQQFAKERTYAPIPDAVVKRIDEKLKLLKTGS